MFFSKITLRSDTADLRRLARLAPADAYKQHKLVWRFFPEGPDHTRDFLYRREHKSDELAFYVVSSRQPVADAALWHIQTKTYEPTLRAGQRLGFSLRANPVRTKKPDPPDSNPKKRKRHDVVMEAKRQFELLGQDWSQQRLEASLVHDAGMEWLAERAGKSGFEVQEDEVVTDNYCRHRFGKRGNDGISVSTLDYNGVLTVVDPTAFVGALYQGVGPAKGFGCGLLLVRRTGHNPML